MPALKIGRPAARFAAILVIPFLALGLSGCTSGSSGSASIEAAQQATPTESSTPKPGEATGSHVGDNGGFIVGEPVITKTDDRGTYAVNPSPRTKEGQKYFPVDTARFAGDSSLFAGGFPEDQFEKAMAYANGFLYDIVLNSSIADVDVSYVDEAYTSWANEERNDYTYSADVQEDVNRLDVKLYMTGVDSETGGWLPPLVRDGLPRNAEKKDSPGILLEDVSAFANAYGYPGLLFRYNIDYYYRVADEPAVAYVAKVLKITPEELLKTRAKEQVKDGKGVNYLRVYGTYDVLVDIPPMSSQLEIGGLNHKLEVSPDEFISLSE